MYLMYIIQGTIMACVNSLLLMPIARFEFVSYSPTTSFFLEFPRYRALNQRKEYVLYGGLALIDMINGIGFLSCGIYRLIVTELGTAFPQIHNTQNSI